ncbi:MAG: group II intron maturase-specific domain-containing protein, partial [Macellibacteroides fermentans]|uniref:group II intron maturase-specific domain-containing protein n=1 Tax=Macellibacteroides fermentans TaxID=879969 RepID=UPI003AC994BE
GYAWLKQRLSQYIRGWLTYYSLADMNQFIQKTDGWYRRRLRTYIWKNWKKISTKSHNLQKCGINKHQAWQWANTRKVYWHISTSWVIHRAITDESLDREGYPQIMRLYLRMNRK